MKAFSQACQNNKVPILDRLRPLLAARHSVLEIGSGTGQHATFLAAALPHLVWQTSDVAQNHAGIEAWIDGVDNVLPPLDLDVDAGEWPLQHYDAVFSANTSHIMHWPTVKNMFGGISRVLNPGGVFALYGPFNYRGEFTSPSNEAFDRDLRANDSGMGIRDFEAVRDLGVSVGLTVIDDHTMPANNRMLVWERGRIGTA